MTSVCIVKSAWKICDLEEEKKQLDKKDYT
jgi:hypothetical protein